MKLNFPIKVGITGQSGFVGTYLFNVFSLQKKFYKCVPFEDCFFEEQKSLRAFVKKCDVIVHFAAVNRHPDPAVIYETNIRLVKQLIEALEAEKVTPHVLFSSSTQETMENVYGKSKLEGRMLLEQWATRNSASFTGMVVPNVYGPFGLPNYNSFIATFCYKMTHNETPKIIQDSEVSLIYIGSLCQNIADKIIEENNLEDSKSENYPVPFDFQMKVTDLLSLLKIFQNQYYKNGFIPKLNNINELNLFNTFRSYIDNETHFPINLIKHSDSRGVFVETLKLGVGGQVSFSTTVPGITRGNHYHTRKIERFTVIKGKAKIQLRKIGSNEIIDFYLDGKQPSYVDIPIWFTHNIINIGEDELYTQFWINEWYNQDDSDTFFENV